MRRARWLASLVLALTAPPLMAGDLPQLEDLHLPLLARSSAELARVRAVTAHATQFATPERFEQKPGGAASVRARATADAFSLSSATMPFAREMDFKLGNALFRKTWVAAPASTRASDGLGPLYNARACQDCHLKDGRGHPPEGTGDGSVSMFLRLSIPADTATQAAAAGQIAGYLATLPEPVYGEQLQDFAIPGHAAEGQMHIEWRELPVELADGATVLLRRPTYAVADPGYGALHPEVMLSPRVAPQMIGLGLLEAIPAADILALADPEDADGDGISGRPNVVMSLVHGVPMLGRFGHKAGNATVLEQSAAAFAGDMGLSTHLHLAPWGECTMAQTACRTAPHGQEPGIRDGLEVDRASLDLVAFYARNLAVPERRKLDDPQVLRGKQVFYALNCSGCHTPKFVTHRLADQPEQSFQLIWPYSDLLLHDMGEGLADNRPEGRASGREWRTAPLWGIGLTPLVSGHSYYLHDGRARSLLEAVLWHGGEAQAARDGVVALPTTDRDALIAFLESL